MNCPDCKRELEERNVGEGYFGERITLKEMIPWVPIYKDIMESKHWRELTHAEQLVYLNIKINFNGSNNGEIPFRYSSLEGKQKGCFSSATISKALKGLCEKGWIERTRHGGLYRNYCLYRLTLKYDRVWNNEKRKKRSRPQHNMPYYHCSYYKQDYDAESVEEN